MTTRSSRTTTTSSTHRKPDPLPARDVLDAAVAAIVATKGEDLVALDLRRLSSVCDYFVIASGSSEQHLRALAKAVVTDVAAAGARPFQREGEVARRWILLDYVDVVVHLFHREARDYYRLESLWGDAEPYPLEVSEPDDDRS